MTHRAPGHNREPAPLAQLAATRHILTGVAGFILAALGTLHVTPVAARPALIEHAHGTGMAAHAGGGAGQVGGVNAVFANPGALNIQGGHEIEMGMMGMSEGISPYTLFGSRSGDWTYALGHAYDDRVGPFRNAVLAGASREVAPGAHLGLSMRSQGGAMGFGVDADAGLLLRPRGWGFLEDWAVLGLAARNLAESGVGPSPEGYETRRSYALSLGARREEARLLFLPVHAPNLAYEFRADGLGPSGYSHIFTSGAGFTPSGALSLRATLRLPHEGSAVVALGGFLEFPVGSGGLRCGYAFSTAGLAGGLGAPSHSLSVNLAVGLRLDRQPPWVSVEADKVFLDSALPGSDRVHFRLRASDRTAVESGSDRGADFAPAGSVRTGEAKAPGEGEAGGRGELREWSLSILALDPDGRKGPPVKTFAGRDLPPRLIRWDGRDEAGALVGPGFYAFRLRARDKSGNAAETPWQLVEVGALAQPEADAPSGDGSASEDILVPGKPATVDSTNRVLPPILEGEDG